MKNDKGGLFESNIAAITKYQPDFSSGELLDAEKSIYTFELRRDKDGLPNLKCEREGKTVYIHGEDSVIAAAAERTEQIALKGNGLIVSFGLGFGYEAREIIKKMDAGTNFVIVEPCPEALELVLNNADITDIVSAPNVHLRFFDSKAEAYSFFRRFISRNNYENLAAFVVSPYVELFFDKCRDLFFVIDDIRSSYEMNASTVRRFTSLWQENALMNVKHNLGSRLVSDFFGKFTGIPAVIVSAGPSLMKNVGLLKGMEDRCLIISVDTALKPLIEHGISPHFVVSVDGQRLVARKFAGLDYGRYPLIYVPTSSADVVEGHSGTKILSVVQDIFYKKALDYLGKDTGIIEMGGSVATSAFSFARLSGCDPIILIGQDLSYPEMKSHYEGAAFYKTIDADKAQGFLSVPSVDGGTVFTDNVFLSYITWFQTYANGDKTGRTYIDATEGGAILLGFENATLAETIQRHMQKSGVQKIVADAFEEAPPLSQDEKKYIREKYKSAAAFIDGIKERSRDASNQLRRIHAILSKSEPNYHAVKSAYRRISSFETKMKNAGDMLEALGIALTPLTEELNAGFENAEFKNDLEKNRFAALSYAKYYGEISERSREFIELLKKCAENPQ